MSHKAEEILELFDELLYDAPLDFWGTGGRKEAEDTEKRWNKEVKNIRTKLSELANDGSVA